MKNTGLLIAAVLLAAGAALGLYAARSALKGGAPAGLSSAPETPSAVPSNLPPLEESDEVVRGRASALSADPSFREWLKLESLIPRLVSATTRIGHGGVPRDIFAAFAPRGKFSIVKKNGKAFV